MIIDQQAWGGVNTGLVNQGRSLGQQVYRGWGYTSAATVYIYTQVTLQQMSV